MPVDATPHATCCWCGSRLVQGTVKDAAAWLCPTPACWKRQVAHALVVTGKPIGRPRAGADRESHCVNVPLPKQVEFRERPEKYVLFGGAAGPGKSHEARWALYEKCLTIPGFEALLLRETFGELERTHMRRMESEQDQVGAVFTPSAHLMRFPNKSLIELGHMEDAAAVRKYLSTEYDAIVPDEGALYNPDSLLSLSTRARSKKPAVNAAGGPKFWVPTNPGGPASQVLLDYFIDHTPDFDERPHLRDKYNPAEWAFVPALLDDNPYLDPNYDAALAVEKPWRYQQLRYGNFRVFAGQFFPTWQEDRHVRVIDVPEGVRWFRSMDWGYNAPGCVLWWAVLGDGRLYIRSEFKFQQMDISEVRERIAIRDRELGVKHASLFGDPAMQAKTGQATMHGESIAQALGGGYIAADNDRFNGWMRCQQILRDAPDGDPWLLVHPDCRYLIRSIPAAKSDADNLDDVDTEMDDHALDAWRYGAMSRPAPRASNSKAPVKDWSLGWLKGRSQKPTGILGGREVRVA
jgi:hypothetical protein